MEKPNVCLSREEQDSIRAISGTAEETVSLSQMLSAAVLSAIPIDEQLAVGFNEEESVTRRALQIQPLPVFAETRSGKT